MKRLAIIIVVFLFCFSDLASASQALTKLSDPTNKELLTRTVQININDEIFGKKTINFKIDGIITFYDETLGFQDTMMIGSYAHTIKGYAVVASTLALAIFVNWLADSSV